MRKDAPSWDRVDAAIRLPDGRSLSYRLLGDPQGRPLMMFHGTPGSRAGHREGDPLATTPGLRLILPDRPGYGGSDIQPHRTLSDWPKDVVQLADHLGLPEFAVLGESGGGPHALVCAHDRPDRVKTALLVASPAPPGFKGSTDGMELGNRIGVWVGKYAPWLLRRLIRTTASGFAKDPARAVSIVANQMAEPDQRILEDESMRAALTEEFAEAYRQGVEGQVADSMVLSSKGWGFELANVSVPVHVWHGEEDVLVTRNMAEYLGRTIPGATLHIVEEAGHLLLDRDDVNDEIRAAVARAFEGRL